MGRISGNIALTQFKHVIEKRKNTKGEQITCLVIPLEQNDLTLTEKGNVYVNWVAWDRKTVSQVEGDKSTHLINQQLPKEKAEAMKAQKIYPPTLGNLTNWADVPQTGAPGEPAPNTVDMTANPDDLPF